MCLISIYIILYIYISSIDNPPKKPMSATPKFTSEMLLTRKNHANGYIGIPGHSNAIGYLQ